MGWIYFQGSKFLWGLIHIWLCKIMSFIKLKPCMYTSHSWPIDRYIIYHYCWQECVKFHHPSLYTWLIYIFAQYVSLKQTNAAYRTSSSWYHHHFHQDISIIVVDSIIRCYKGCKYFTKLKSTTFHDISLDLLGTLIYIKKFSATTCTSTYKLYIHVWPAGFIPLGSSFLSNPSIRIQFPHRI